MRPIDSYFLNHDEPAKSCLHFLRKHILDISPEIAEIWSYGMPFYTYRKKRFCYLWMHKTLKQPYIGIVDGHLIDHPDLIIESRKRMKIFLIDPARNIPIKKINALLKEAIALLSK